MARAKSRKNAGKSKGRSTKTKMGKKQMSTVCAPEDK